MPRVAIHPSRTNSNNPLLTSGPNTHPGVLKRNQVRLYDILAVEEVKPFLGLSSSECPLPPTEERSPIRPLRAVSKKKAGE